jgi:hypothetical protein
MRVELVNGRYLLCGHILKRSQLAVGQTWAPASGADRTVKIVGIENDWVRYEWTEGEQLRQHEKESFAFQCRYCLVLPDKELPACVGEIARKGITTVKEYPNETD